MFFGLLIGAHQSQFIDTVALARAIEHDQSGRECETQPAQKKSHIAWESNRRFLFYARRKAGSAGASVHIW